MKAFYIMIATLMIFIILGGFVLLNEVLKLYTLTNRIEDKMISAGWSAFTDVDLDTLAKRKSMDNEEDRFIYLDKAKAEETITDLLVENLRLDSSYYPTDDSFIILKDFPVTIDAIEIYNPSDLPAVTPNSKTVNETSIYISLQYPINMKFVGDCYKKIEVIVDTKTFYSQFQR